MKLTNTELQECKRLRSKLTNIELYNHINAQRGPKNKLDLCITSFRTYLYKKGVKKCEMLRWTPSEKQFLLDHYTSIGNIEIAKRLSKPNRPFKNKQVQKQMQLLGIKRSKEMVNSIINRKKLKGEYSQHNFKKWETVKAPEGEKRIWKTNGKSVRVVIKINGTFISYAHHRYIELHGSIPDGHKVYFKDNNPLNIEDENLIVLSAGSLKRNEKLTYAKNSRQYHLEQTPPKSIAAVEQKLTSPLERISIRIDDKTIVYVKPGTNIEQFKKDYQNRRIGI